MIFARILSILNYLLNSMLYSYHRMICLFQTSLQETKLFWNLRICVCFVSHLKHSASYVIDTQWKIQMKHVYWVKEIFTIYFAVYLHYRVIVYYTEILGTFLGEQLNLILYFKNRTHKRHLLERNSVKITPKDLVTLTRNKMHIKFFF